MLRAVGENPEAAFAVGTNPVLVRIAAIIVSGAFAGLGGAVLSLQEVCTFTDGMTNGRGFIALAAIIVGRWTPSGALFGCLLFGAVAAIELRLHGSGLPVSSYVIQMVPISWRLVCSPASAAPHACRLRSAFPSRTSEKRAMVNLGAGSAAFLRRPITPL